MRGLLSLTLWLPSLRLGKKLFSTRFIGNRSSKNDYMKEIVIGMHFDNQFLIIVLVPFMKYYMFNNAAE